MLVRLSPLKVIYKVKKKFFIGGLFFLGGYCLALDMTARDFQNEAKSKGLPWTMAKVGDYLFKPINQSNLCVGLFLFVQMFDTSLPVSDFIPLGNFKI